MKAKLTEALNITCTLLAMKLNAVCELNGHRVERVACGWIIDDKCFTWSHLRAAELLKQTEPCQAVKQDASEAAAWENP